MNTSNQNLTGNKPNVSHLDLTPGKEPPPVKKIPAQEVKQAVSQGVNLSTSDQGMTEEKAAAVNADKLSQLGDATINEWFEQLEDIADRREELNNEVKAIKLKAKDWGIPAAAIDAIFKRGRMSAAKREQLDSAFARLARAQGVFYQTSLFESAVNNSAK